MLQLSNSGMIGVPHRADRYEPSYQQAMQPLYQTPIRHQESYAYTQQPHLSPSYPVSPHSKGNYTYQNPQQQQHTAAVAPPTPPAEELKSQTLPSISSLLGISENTAKQEQNHNVSSVIPQQHDYSTPEQLSSSYTMHGRLSLPATPPLVQDGPMDGTQSPSTMSTRSNMSISPTYYLGQHMNGLESQGRSYSEPNIMKPHSLASQQSLNGYPSPQYTPSSFVSSPNISSYYSGSPLVQGSGMYAQRPLPSNFPPTFTLPFGGHANVTGPGATNPWQHHHYISASNQSTFPQSQDRYVCPTCSKAFSRPSSLRIHSHSHTGEKPFKCSHNGCGKAFSVRSNMKRHERGCHAGVLHSGP